MTLIDDKNLLPKVRSRQLFDAINNFWIESSKRDEPSRLGLMKRRSLSGPNWECEWRYLTSPHSVIGLWAAEDHLHQVVVGEENQAAIKDHCIRASYLAIDSGVASLPPQDAIFYVSHLQEEFGKVQQYASRCIIGLVSQIRRQDLDSLSVRIPWIEEAITLANENEEEKSLDVIYENIDEMLLASKFEECNATLSLLPVNRLNNAQLITILTATLPARSELLARSKFFEAVKSVLVNRGTDAEVVLAGLG